MDQYTGAVTGSRCVRKTVLLPATSSCVGLVMRDALVLLCRNRKFALLSGTEARRDSKSCPPGHNNLFSERLQKEPGDFSISDFMSKAATWLLVSAVLSLALGLVFLYLFKWHSRIMTRITIQIQVLLPAVMGIAAIASGQVGGGLILILLALLAALVFYMWYVPCLLQVTAVGSACGHPGITAAESRSSHFPTTTHTWQAVSVWACCLKCSASLSQVLDATCHAIIQVSGAPISATVTVYQHGHVAGEGR